MNTGEDCEKKVSTSPQAPHWDGLPADRCGMYKNFAQKQINGILPPNNLHSNNEKCGPCKFRNSPAALTDLCRLMSKNVCFHNSIFLSLLPFVSFLFITKFPQTLLSPCYYSINSQSCIIGIIHLQSQNELHSKLLSIFFSLLANTQFKKN